MKNTHSTFSRFSLSRVLSSAAVFLILLVFSIPVRSTEANSRKRRRRCRPGWHLALNGSCVRDNCPLGWVRGKDHKCRRRESCPQGFMKRGRFCVQKNCPRGYVRDSRERCIPNIGLECGAGAFRNPAGICVLVPRIEPEPEKKPTPSKSNNNKKK